MQNANISPHTSPNYVITTNICIVLAIVNANTFTYSY